VKTLRVVGVARDLKYRTLDDNTPIAFVYAPLQQQYRPRLTIVARSSQGQRVTSEIRAFLGSINRNLPLLTTQTLEEFTATGLLRQRVAAGLSGTLGVVGVLLAAIGIYGVTSYSVARRTREIGVRVALGAQRSDVITMVLKQGMLMVAIGCGVGVVLAAVSSRMLVAFLFGIQPLDPVAFGAAAALFLLIGLAASYNPAHRAVQINATDALRSE
jgi:putative ABC transport system permease protein